MDSSSDKAVNIKTVARVRPCFDGTNRQSSLTINSESSTVTVKLPNKEQIFHLDNAFDENSTQDTIYKSVAQPIVVGFLGGTNGTIFAYGQTGSGKTYTMNGLERDTKADSPTRGIIVRAVENIFENLNATVEKNPCSFKYSLKCAFIQVYKERPFDLLQSGDVEVTIQGSREQVSFRGAKEFEVKSVEECIKYLRNGWKKRKTAGTSMNVESSRSHAIFILTLFTETIEGTLINNRTSRLNFGDLAGSERQKDTNNTGERFKEAGSINQDLLSLSRIIRYLPTAKQGTFIPYSSSKLTMLLRDSLGGNARTAIIVTIHSNCDFVRDTMSTLTFAENCKKVKNTAKVNEAVSMKDVGLWKAEIQRLSNEKQQIKEEKEQREKILQNEKKQLEETIVEMKIKHEQEIKMLYEKQKREMIEFQKRTINSTLLSKTFIFNKSDETIHLSRENDHIIIKEIMKSLLDQVKSLQGGDDTETETSSGVENDSNGYHQNFILPQDQPLAFSSLENLTGPSFMDNLSFEQSDSDIRDETAHFIVYEENDRKNESSVVGHDDFFGDKSKHNSFDSNNGANSDNTFTADRDEGHDSKNFLDKNNPTSFDVSESDDRHKSLSPENEVESNDSSPKIIDFNVSQDHDFVTEDNFGKLLAICDLNSDYDIDESAATAASNNSLNESNQNRSLSGVSEGGNQGQNIADYSCRDNTCNGDFGIDESSVESTSFPLFEKSPEQNAAQNSAHFGAPERVYQEQNIANNSFNGDFGNQTYVFLTSVTVLLFYFSVSMNQLFLLS
uniref:Kinesin motor domain-containing protein n=1 Tax=Panagrolaimus davidi TaxID=227884 RepID=A0A914Q888_9BILA